MTRLARYLSVLEWGRAYNGGALTNDMVAAGIVTIMLIPQSLAYAMLAGLPPEVGLYASILPIIAYALFGSSRALAVGPVAVISLMTLTAASSVAPPGSAEFIAAALVLALLSGLILLLMGVLRLGEKTNGAWGSTPALASSTLSGGEPGSLPWRVAPTYRAVPHVTGGSRDPWHGAPGTPYGSNGSSELQPDPSAPVAT